MLICTDACSLRIYCCVYEKQPDSPYLTGVWPETLWLFCYLWLSFRHVNQLSFTSASLVLISSMDRFGLLCSSKSLLKSVRNPSLYCLISGAHLIKIHHGHHYFRCFLYIQTKHVHILIWLQM